MNHQSRNLALCNCCTYSRRSIA